MYQFYQLTVPPSSVSSEVQVLDINIGKVYLDFIDVGFPHGCFGLVHMAIYYNDVRIVPLNRDTDLSYDGFTVRIPVGVEIDDEPYLIRCMAYSDDDTYYHTISIGLGYMDISKKPVTSSDIVNVLYGG